MTDCKTVCVYDAYNNLESISSWVKQEVTVTGFRESLCTLWRPSCQSNMIMKVVNPLPDDKF